MNHRYYIITSSNGTVTVNSEWDDINRARVAFHNTCASFWNAPDVIEGIVELVYSADLAVVDGYIERISHPQIIEPTDEVETNE